MDEVRDKTGKPVTTSERLITYKTDPGLCKLGDFIFPDCALEWVVADGTNKGIVRAATPAEAFKQVIVSANEASSLCHDVSRPILLKMIGFPSGATESNTLLSEEAGKFNEESQAEFFTTVTSATDDSTSLPANVRISFMTSFDPAWKADAINWASYERHTGLFAADRKPKKAAMVFRDWFIAK